MADLLKVVVTGASGRMGQTLVNLITRHNEIELVGALEHPKHQWIGQDIGVAMGGSALGVVVSEDPIKVMQRQRPLLILPHRPRLLSSQSWPPKQEQSILLGLLECLKTI